MSYALAEIETDLFSGRLAFGPVPLTPRDITDMKAWGADIVVTLMSRDELARLNLADLSDRLSAAGFETLEMPIIDRTAPCAGFDAAWRTAGPRLLDLLRSGGRVLVHCRAGQGRSGTVAARLLRDAGLDGATAIGMVRRVRPAAIETAEQEAWLSADPK